MSRQYTFNRRVQTWAKLWNKNDVEDLSVSAKEQVPEKTFPPDAGGSSMETTRLEIGERMSIAYLLQKEEPS